MKHSRTTHKKAAWMVTMLALVATAISLEAVKVKSAADPNFDFSQLKTWDWNPSAPGSVKVVMTVLAESQKSEPVQRKWEPVIMKAVEDQLAAQGYKRSTGYAPDFFVTYY